MAEHLETKSLGPFEIKDAAKGEVEAVVNTLNIVDRDGDVILPGAIKDGTVVKVSAYGHDTILDGAPHAGLATIRVTGTEARAHIKYFMGVQRGREAFETIRETGEHAQYSIGFRNVKTGELSEEWKSAGARRVISSLDVIEVSHVFEGANQMTGTLAVKAAETPALDPEADAKVKADAEERAAAEARAAELKAAALQRLAREEYDRFQRTMKRLGIR